MVKEQDYSRQMKSESFYRLSHKVLIIWYSSVSIAVQFIHNHICVFYISIVNKLQPTATTTSNDDGGDNEDDVFSLQPAQHATLERP